MSSALNGLGEFSVDLLKSNHFCTGVKRGREYRCGGDADENAINNAIDLLVEAVRRLVHWHVWDPWWVDELMDELLLMRDGLEVRLSKYGRDVVDSVVRLIDVFIDYGGRFREYWLRVGNEVGRLVGELLSGRVNVVVRRGALGISIHTGSITLKVDRTETGIPVQLILDGLDGVYIDVPDIFKMAMSKDEYEKFVGELLFALKLGFAATDETILKNEPVMSTTQSWQALLWSILYSGRIYIHMDTVNVNENDVSILWHLVADHRSLKRNALKSAGKLSRDGLIGFIFTSILGDGTTRIRDTHGSITPEIKITMSNRKRRDWEQLLNKLGIRWSPTESGSVTYIYFYSSYAVELARMIVNTLPPVLQDLLDAMNFKKWETIKEIAALEPKFRRGEMQIDVAGINFSVHFTNKTVYLKHNAKGDEEVKEVLGRLKSIYGDEFIRQIHIRRSDKYQVIVIPMRVVETQNDLRIKAAQVLCRKYGNIKDEKKRQVIIKHLKRLTPTKGAAAVN